MKRRSPFRSALHFLDDGGGASNRLFRHQAYLVKPAVVAINLVWTLMRLQTPQSIAFFHVIDGAVGTVIGEEIEKSPPVFHPIPAFGARDIQGVKAVADRTAGVRFHGLSSLSQIGNDQIGQQDDKSQDSADRSVSTVQPLSP